MLDTNQLAHVERSIRFLEGRVSADVPILTAVFAIIVMATLR